ncbi:hypothetical protein BX616_006377 [Lobosporangium transversale]|nr:hypothetical protein BX616_006377 [Lobosporangium transversale]
MTNNLNERIWESSGSSSIGLSQSSESNVNDEAQTVLLISCLEQVQTSLRRYQECKDFLSAKAMQEEENALEQAYVSTQPIDHIQVHGRHIDNSSTFAAAAAALDNHKASDDYYDHGYVRDKEDYDQGYTMDQSFLSHFRESDEPYASWHLDPRKDFKANQSKLKTGISMEQIRQLCNERKMKRWVEKNPQNSVHGIKEDPLKLRPEMLTLDDATQEDDLLEGAATEEPKEAEDHAEESSARLKVEESKPTTSLELKESKSSSPMGVEENGGQKENFECIQTSGDKGNDDIGNEEEGGKAVQVKKDEQDEKVSAKAEKDDDKDDNDDKDALSDESWEEIPEHGIANLLVEDENGLE